MATQSLYRRYRPRRFSELKGQDHVVRALRDAVRSGREGQAYLFSGPRGTGKTTSARILAKVLNCAAPVDGEPCCECESCLAVERGTSYDVHELDAASNNGVEAIRDLIEKASLGTPGRHRVYILDEVHMLSKAAEAALLKTLEEPPPHVVFVLATTDPQRVTETVRSRTQHLHFHLLPVDTLAEHVRWVAADAGLELDDRAFDTVVTQGGGSARDTLSALELMAATGGDLADVLDLDDIVRAMSEREPGQALAAVARAMNLGHEARTLTEALVRHLRDGFLALMAPELVQLPSTRVEQISETAQELGAPALVRAIERLGTALVEMRHAPDPRVMLEVALVQLTHDESASDIGALVDRIERLERATAHGGAAGGAAPGDASTASGATGSDTPVDPTTGRAVLGGRARRAPRETPADAGAPAPAPDPDPSDSTAAEAPSDSAPAPPSRTEPTPAADGTASPTVQPGRDPAEVWEREVRPGLKPLVRAIYSGGTFTRQHGDQWFFAVPNAAHGEKCELHRAQVEQALAAAVGASVQIVIEVGSGAASAAGAGPEPAAPAETPDQRPRADAAASSETSSVGTGERPSGGRPTGNGRTDDDPAEAGAGDGAHGAAPTEPPAHADDDIDLDELTDAPPETALSPIDRLAQAFPGAELVDDD